MISMQNIVDTEGKDESKWNVGGSRYFDRNPNRSSLSTTCNYNTDENIAQRNNSMARVVMNIISSISVFKQAHNLMPDKYQCDNCNIETDGSPNHSDGKARAKEHSVEHTNLPTYDNNLSTRENISQKVSLKTRGQTFQNHNTSNIKINTRRVPSSDIPQDQPYDCDNAICCVDVKTPGELNVHQQCKLTDKKVGKTDILASDRVIPHHGDGNRMHDQRKCSERGQNSNEGRVFMTKHSLSASNNADNLHKILSKKVHDSNVQRNDNSSRSEENCTTSKEHTWSLKRIMEEYDERFPDEDDEATSYHSRYHQ